MVGGDSWTCTNPQGDRSKQAAQRMHLAGETREESWHRCSLGIFTSASVRVVVISSQAVRSFLFHPNIYIVPRAKEKGITVIGLLGKTGGKLKDMVDVPLIVDCPITDRIQEIHIKVIHSLIGLIEESL